MNSSAELRGAERYNQVVEEYLNEKNGKGWEEKFNAEVEKAVKIFEDRASKVNNGADNQ